MVLESTSQISRETKNDNVACGEARTNMIGERLVEPRWKPLIINGREGENIFPHTSGR
jgi:hypothetical protein